MLTRPIPSTGETMPVIGLGTWRAFDVGTDAAVRQRLREVCQLLLDAGGRIVDTSPMYGRAEAVTGDLLAENGSTVTHFSRDQGVDDGAGERDRADAALRAAVADRGNRFDTDP
jgi:aryl-alcohol dehydrogenase-like predicted oxidoreductase